MMLRLAAPVRASNDRKWREPLSFRSAAFRRRPWLVTAAILAALIEFSLVIYWFLEPEQRQRSEPGLVLFGLLTVLAGIPPVREAFEPDEADRCAERVVTFLEDKGVLYNFGIFEKPKDCYHSAKIIRDSVTAQMQTVSRLTAIWRHCDSIRTACQEFMRELEVLKIENVAYDSEIVDDDDKSKRRSFFQQLLALRHKCAVPIRAIERDYGIDVGGRLGEMPSLPNAGLDDVLSS